jgi:hypothetical protein
MAQITIGEGLWSTIRGYLNTMFTELYASVGGGVGNTNNYSQTIDLDGGDDPTRIITTLTSKPKHITIWDDTGKVVGPNTIPDIQRSLVGGVYVFDIYCSDPLTNLELEISY